MGRHGSNNKPELVDDSKAHSLTQVTTLVCNPHKLHSTRRRPQMSSSNQRGTRVDHRRRHTHEKQPGKGHRASSIEQTYLLEFAIIRASIRWRTTNTQTCHTPLTHSVPESIQNEHKEECMLRDALEGETFPIKTLQAMDTLWLPSYKLELPSSEERIKSKNFTFSYKPPQNLDRFVTVSRFVDWTNM